jgi:hypothetical protein
MSQALIDELSKAEYASLSDQAAADAANLKTVVIRVWVDTADAITHATQEGYYAWMKHVSESDPPDPNGQAFQCWAAAKNIIGYVESPKTEKIDMDSEKAVGMKLAMVGCGFATSAQVASLDALANRTLRWVDHVSAGTQSAHSVRVIRDVINGSTAKRAGWTQQNVDRYNTTQAAIDAWKHGDPDMVI